MNSPDEARVIKDVFKYRSTRLAELARIQHEMWQLVQAERFPDRTIA
jgi:hypothetical protein